MLFAVWPRSTDSTPARCSRSPPRRLASRRSRSRGPAPPAESAATTAADHHHISAQHIDHVAGLTHAGEQGQIQVCCVLPVATAPFIGQHPHHQVSLHPSRAAARRRLLISPPDTSPAGGLAPLQPRCAPAPSAGSAPPRIRSGSWRNPPRPPGTDLRQRELTTTAVVDPEFFKQSCNGWWAWVRASSSGF
ncbi:hypothetical protein FB106_1192 [Synechococcus sp. Ace-Pa]|nr:hypothetical protein FB106_1192 [Synechococcus sp. Ace-Pa]